MKTENIIDEKSYKFALRIIKAYTFLSHEKHEFVMSRQLLRCGTAIGALVSEARFAQSKADFVNKMYIALKEANETRYWLNLLHDSGFIADVMFDSILPDITEIISILASIVKTSKNSP